MTTKSSIQNLLPTETLDLENGLSLTPRLKFNFSVHRADLSVAPIDEWRLKTSLLDYLKSTFSVAVPGDDLSIKSFNKELKKRKRNDAVAVGTLVVRELGFLEKYRVVENDVAKKLKEWREEVAERMDGLELSLAGAKFKLSVEVPCSEEFRRLRKEWEEISAFGSSGRDYPKGGKRQPDTIVLRGIPSRWLAEPRVSSKPSVLVTHTIFSVLGKIRNLDVGEDNDFGKDADEDNGDIVSGLHCKVVIRFEEHKEFCNALKILCGRSLQKQGSPLKADYEVAWDKDVFGRNDRSQYEENRRRMPTSASPGNYRSEAARYPSHASRFSESESRSKRFKE